MHSLANCYTIMWDSDLSDRGFSHINDTAIAPEVNNNKITDTERIDRKPLRKITQS